MWPSFSLNRPLVWLGIIALGVMVWLPLLLLRLAALVVVIMALLDVARRIYQEHCHRRLSEKALELSEDGVMICDARNRIVSVNAAFTRITGFQHQEVLGRDPSILSSGLHDHAFYERYWESLNTTGRWEGEIWNRRKRGEHYPEWLRVQTYMSRRGRVEHYIALFTDISRHKARGQDLKRVGFEDPLTGLPNRRRLHDLLTSRLQHLRAGEGLDLALIDIDGFKAVNDGLGVDGGDRLLARFGQRLSTIAPQATVGRLGGDEFMLIRTTTFDDHEKWISGLREHLSEPFEYNDHSLRLGFSIGSCRVPEDGNDSGLLFQRLESALYSAKHHGRSHDQRFQPSLEVKGDRQLTLVNDLRRALIQGDQLELHYQTQHRLADNSLVGMEALLRWRHPEHGMISPSDFIPLAERHGLMTALGSWVIEQAVAQQAKWLARNESCVPVWVNISVLQLIQGDLESRIAASLAQHGVPTRLLGLELTESVLLDERAGDISPRLNALRDNGHPIAIDDFGTGYSSLAYLKHLPVDKLKLDRMFIHALPGDSGDAAIVKAVLAMARGLKLEVIAEGVETIAQRDHLTADGCQLCQGFLFSRPEAASSIEVRYPVAL
ncbi:putative bifunctional diguanylate cyclase/phosphodiesterase [Halomonas sp. GXIMD04776]|uniref:putative bifunctional diguanylate cyclase/phosphodiesterase n=1 Tax=Halomonas sp. GXIMD04776 TaxID=3415605 RepID=UPI003CAD260A